MKNSVAAVACGAIICGVLSSPESRAAPPPPSLELPKQSDVCVGGWVARKKLSMWLLKDADAIKLVNGNDENNDLWRTIFLDGCQRDAVCAPGTGDDDCANTVKACKIALTKAQVRGFALFSAISTKNASYEVQSDLTALPTGDAQLKRFFSSGTVVHANSISCLAPKKDQTTPGMAAAPEPAKPAFSPFRVRGSADDLYIDRILQPDAFKSTSQATVTFTGDNTTAATHSAKFIGAFGYAFRFGNLLSAGQVVPYLSFNQSFTDTQLKPRTIAATNYVAAGVLVSENFPDPTFKNLVHVISAKPQYLQNTADQSELASMRVIWAPWTSYGSLPFGVDLNTSHIIGGLPWTMWGRILFDLRNDFGDYITRGNNRNLFPQYVSFERVGTRAGFSLTTDAMPSMTLTIAETYMYGAMGNVRNLNLFEASLTDNINDYIGLTAKYTSGRDIDTALPTRTWTLGLAARY